MICRTVSAANALRIYQDVRDKNGNLWFRADDAKWRRSVGYTAEVEGIVLTTREFIDQHGPITTIEKE